MPAILVGALFQEDDILSFSKSADFQAVPVEVEKGMYRALVQLFESASNQLEMEQAPLGSEPPAPEAA